MRYRLFIMAATICCTHAMAQDNIETLLQEIEKNNTTLKALRYDTEAQKSANRSENALPDPELEVGYLWGKPSTIGSRKDFSAKQSFDIPAITGQRTRQSKQKDRLADSQYNLQRTALLLQAKLLCIDLIYYNARIATLNERIKASRIVAEGQAKQLSCGDISQTTYNYTALNLSVAEAELKQTESERMEICRSLTALNGGFPVTLNINRFTALTLPLSFAQWYDGNNKTTHPQTALARQEMETTKGETALAKAESLPSFSIGYTGEFTQGEHYQGVAVGVSVPLWRGKRKVAQAKAAQLAAQERMADNEHQLRAQQEALFYRAQSLHNLATSLTQALSQSNSTPLLQKALQEGEISTAEYFTELEKYYDAADKALIAERDSQKAYAELHAAEL